MTQVVKQIELSFRVNTWPFNAYFCEGTRVSEAKLNTWLTPLQKTKSIILKYELSSKLMEFQPSHKANSIRV